jgi:hypothetical protein
VHADPPPLDAVVVRSYDQAMTTHEKLIQLIDGMSEADLEEEYARLKDRTPRRLTDAEFEAALEDARKLSEQLNLQIDVVQLIRDERDWHANRS